MGKRKSRGVPYPNFKDEKLFQNGRAVCFVQLKWKRSLFQIELFKRAPAGGHVTTGKLASHDSPVRPRDLRGTGARFGI
jgi:hypothetical protein